MDDQDKQYTNELYKTLSYSNEQFDKNVLFIASGALGVSFAFIEKIVPNMNEAIFKDHLINAWIMYAVVIFVSMVSHFVSSLSLRWSISNHNSKNFERGRSNWNMLIRCLNILLMIGLLIGTLLLINFIEINI